MIKDTKIRTRAHFRFIAMPCCGQLLCWVNPRLPNYCPECGKHVYPEVKSCVTVSDNDAWIQFKEEVVHDQPTRIRSTEMAPTLHKRG